MKRRIAAWGIVVATAAGCGAGPNGGTSSPGARGADDATRPTRIDSTHDSQTGAGATDMRGGGRGGDHRPEKH